MAAPANCGSAWQDVNTVFIFFSTFLFNFRIHACCSGNLLICIMRSMNVSVIFTTTWSWNCANKTFQCLVGTRVDSIHHLHIHQSKRASAWHSSYSLSSQMFSVFSSFWEPNVRRIEPAWPPTDDIAEYRFPSETVRRKTQGGLKAEKKRKGGQIAWRMGTRFRGAEGEMRKGGR